MSINRFNKGVPEDIEITIDDEVNVTQPESDIVVPDEIVLDEVASTEEVVEEVITEPTTVETEEPQPTQTQPTEQPKSVLGFEDEAEPKVETEIDLSDEVLFKKLSEKLGREVKSIDELSTQDKLESDPYLKSIAEWRERTGRPLEDWLKFNKDFDNMSEVDLAREILQVKYPNFSQAEIEYELESKYTSDEYDTETDSREKSIALKKLIAEGKPQLDNLKASYDTPTEAYLSPEIKADLEIAKQYKEFTQKAEENNKIYDNEILNLSTKATSLKVPLPDNSVIDYRIPENVRKEIPSIIKTMPHWSNEDGTPNYQAIYTDAVKIIEFDNIIKAVGDQMFNAGVESVLKESKNVDFVEPAPAGTNLKSSDIEIEGLDSILNRGRMTIGRR